MSDLDLARRAIGLMDLTELGDNAGEGQVRALCATGAGGGDIPPVAALCVWPRHVAVARAHWAGRVATVVNFPSGGENANVVSAMAGSALAAGADEIDLVLPYRAFLAGRTGEAEAMLAAVRQVTAGRVLKVILETSEYPDGKVIRAASECAIAAGADFIKTSTGKAKAGATLEAARVMLEAIRASGCRVGFKPSGGIRTLDDARAYLALADAFIGPVTAETFRFGASGLHANLAAVIKREAPAQNESAY